MNEGPKRGAGLWRGFRAGLLRRPSRPGDRYAFWTAQGIKTIGVPAVLAFYVLSGWQRSLEAERTVRAEQHAALIAAMQDIVTANREGLADVREALEKLSARTADLAQSELTIRSWVMGRLRCPDCRCPPCPAAPPCAPTIVAPALVPPTPAAPTPRSDGPGRNPAGFPRRW